MALPGTFPFTVGVIETASPRRLNLSTVLATCALLRPLCEPSRDIFCPGRRMRQSMPSSMHAPQPGPGRHLLISRGSARPRMCAS